MCHWKKWIWPGILAVGLLSLLALYFKADFIENDLKTKATAALGAAGLGWASVDFDGRDGTLTGVSPSEDGQSSAEATALAAYDVRVLKNDTTLLAAQSPYVLTANRDGNAVSLGGYVPSEEVRETIVAAAKEAISGATITDNMQLARGAPADLAAIAGFGFSQLSGLTSGEMEVRDTALSMKGVASDFGTFDSVNAALDGTLPGGASLAAKEIIPPTVTPYTWSAQLGANGTTLTGFIPNRETGDALVAKAREALGTDVTDEQVVAAGAPEGFQDAASFALNQLPRFTNGNVSLSNLDLTVNGTAKDSGTFTAATAAIAGALPAGMALAADNIIPPSLSPYPWNADYDGSKVTLGGFVPDVSTRDAILANARAALPEAEVADEQQIAAGAPDTFGDATAFALQQLPRFTSGSVALSDLNLTVNGVARDSGSFNEAVAAADGALPAGMTLASRDILPATVSPYTWNADYDGSRVTLGGFVPDNAARERITGETAAALPNAEIIDEMRVGAGEPGTYAAATSFAIAQLPRFTQGSASISDSALSVRGVASSPENFAAANDALTTLPEGTTLASSDISLPTVSPYAWNADYDGSKVTLGGYVPSEDARARIVADAGETLPNAEIVDQMRLATGAPTGYSDATAFALDQLPRFSSGAVALSDNNLSVRGVALDAANYDAAKAAVAGTLPAGVILTSEQIVPSTVSPYEWNARYDGRRVRLGGFVPDDRARSTILAATRSQLPNAEIIDEMQIANGAPETFSAAAVSGISLLPRFSEGDVALSDLNLTVNGQARSSGDFDAAKATVGGTLDAGMTLAAENIQPAPDLGDYVWMAEKSASSIVLSGNAPSREARAGIGDKAKRAFPNLSVINRIVPREDAPAGFIPNVDKGLGLLERLSTGKASITNQSLSIEGQASSVANYDSAIAEAARDPDYGYRWDVRDIRPARVSPYTWSLDKGADVAIQSGFVPSRGQGNVFVAATRATLGKDVDDRQRVAAGEPENFGNAVSAAISGVNKLDRSSAQITNTNLFVQGRAGSEEEAERIGQEIKASAPANFTVRHQISYPLPAPEPTPVPAAPEPKPEPVACQIDFDALIGGRTIEFATNRAIVREESFGLLDSIAEAKKTCPETRFEIAGHTDSRGRDAYNQGLSEARASAVLEYLAGKGVNADNLVARGYGETRPIADNATVEGRARNRRIEFTILEAQN